MPTKPMNPIEEGDPLDDDPELNERLRKLTPDDPGYDAWLKALLPTNDNRSIGLQVADIRPGSGIDVVQDWRIGEIAVEGKIAWNGLSDHPINQLFDETGMILERVRVVALLALAEAAKVKRVVFA